MTPRTPIPGMGAFAYFKDPEGNVMGLWETTELSPRQMVMTILPWAVPAAMWWMASTT